MMRFLAWIRRSICFNSMYVTTLTGIWVLSLIMLRNNFKPNAVKLSEPKLLLNATDFSRLRQLWRTTIIGAEPDLTVPEIKSTITQLSDSAEALLGSIKPTWDQIWPDLRPITKSVNFRKSLLRLSTIAKSYGVDGTAHYKDAHVGDTLIQALDFISSQAYNSSTVVDPSENWWNYRIGAPLPLMDIAVIMYDELGPRRAYEYGTTVVKMVGSINSRTLKGANRADMCQSLSIAAILTDDEQQLTRARDGFTDVEGEGENSILSKVTTGEGFYEGGSYISHNIYPYTGGYGVEHMLALSQIVTLFQDTPYAFNRTELSVVYEAVESTFLPVMFGGQIMAHARGRNIARRAEPDAFWGSQLMRAVLLLSESAPKPFAARFKSLARYWHENTPYPDLGGTNFTQAMMLNGVYSQRISAALPPVGTYVTPMQDRVMHHQKDWSASVAMASKRIGRYESLNGENLKPWYQGDGMLYLYLKNDLLHYTNDYWPTMDPYHTPGVTNGMNVQPPAKYKFSGHSLWAGGVDWRGKCGSASLNHFSNDKGSSGRKSWFFLVNGIIALGAGLLGSTGSQLHSTIESRNLQVPGARLVIDGIQQDYKPKKAWNVNRKDSGWAHIEGVGGYVFLDGQGAHFKRERRTGKWSEINTYPDYAVPVKYDTCTREYLTIYRNHGTDPTHASYAYGILPTASEDQTEQFSQNPNSYFYILKNSPTLQAITTNSNNTVMANFWSAGKLGSLLTHTPCAAAWGFDSDTDQKFTLSISDPTHAARTISLELSDKRIGRLLQKHVNMTLVQSLKRKGVWKISIDSQGGSGAVYSATFKRGTPGTAPYTKYVSARRKKQQQRLDAQNKRKQRQKQRLEAQASKWRLDDKTDAEDEREPEAEVDQDQDEEAELLDGEEQEAEEVPEEETGEQQSVDE